MALVAEWESIESQSVRYVKTVFEVPHQRHDDRSPNRMAARSSRGERMCVAATVILIKHSDAAREPSSTRFEVGILRHASAQASGGSLLCHSQRTAGTRARPRGHHPLRASAATQSARAAGEPLLGRPLRPARQRRAGHDGISQGAENSRLAMPICSTILVITSTAVAIGGMPRSSFAKRLPSRLSTSGLGSTWGWHWASRSDSKKALKRSPRCSVLRPLTQTSASF